MHIPDDVVLVSVRISKPSTSKVDKSLTQDLATKHGADSSAVRGSKTVLDLRDANRFASRMRAWLRENAIPWSAVTQTATGEKKADAKWAIQKRIVKEFTDINRECREGFESVRDCMYNDYSNVVAERQRALGTAFDANDYPDADEFKSQWDWDMQMEPLKDAQQLEGDFRLAGVPQDMIDEQVDKYRASVGEKIANVASSLVRKVRDEILGSGRDKGLLAGIEQYDPDEGDARKGNTYRDKRLYQNVDELRETTAELADLFPDNEEMADLRDRVANFCDNVRPEDPKIVRDDETVRQQVIDGLKALLDSDFAAKANDDAVKPGGFANAL